MTTRKDAINKMEDRKEMLKILSASFLGNDPENYAFYQQEIAIVNMAIIALKSKSFRCEYCEFGNYIGSDIWICFKKDGEQVARNGICENYQFDTGRYY